MWLIATALGAPAVVPINGSGAVRPTEVGSAMRPVVNGRLEDGFPSAVVLGVGPIPICSGSLITPRVVLSAAHCSGDFPIEAVLQFGAVSFGGSIDDPELSIGLSDAVLHPDYVELDVTTLGEFDLAVTVLEEDAPYPATDFRIEPLTEEVIGSTVVSVGYGITETGEGGGVKRSADLTVSDLDAMFIVSDTVDNGGANICSGDSGGPQYAWEGDRWVQWSVHSWADANCRATSGSTRTDVAADWILDQVEAVHGTRDPCLANGRYDNGVCDAHCEIVDPDCLPGLQLDDGIPNPETSGCATLNRFCTPWAMIFLLGLSRRRSV